MFVSDLETFEKVQELYPKAAIIIEVENGFMVFNSIWGYECWADVPY